KAVLESTLAVLHEAIEADNYDDAEQLAKVAEATARAIGDPLAAIQFSGKEVNRLKTKYAAIKPALATLAREPKDPEANRLVGSFRCFQKGDWERGLALLALGDDAKLRELAEKDQAAPMAADAQTDLGDGWWQLARKETGTVKANLQQRACYWFRRALRDV